MTMTTANGKQPQLKNYSLLWKGLLLLAAVACVVVLIVTLVGGGNGPAVEPPGGSGTAVTPIERVEYNEPEKIYIDEAELAKEAKLKERAAAAAYVTAVATGEKTYPYTEKHSGKICKNPEAQKMVALTFDDGPKSGMTEKYLEILAEYQCYATFFMVGQYVEKYPNSVKQIAAAGHEIGSHSWCHYNLPKKDDATVSNDFQLVAAAFDEVLGKQPAVFRPPYGSVDERVVKEASAKGMATVFWSVDPEDWKEKNSDTLVNNIMSHVKSGDIILLHENKTVTLKALPKLLKALKDDGYTLVTVSRLLYEAQLQQEQVLEEETQGAPETAAE